MIVFLECVVVIQNFGGFLFFMLVFRRRERVLLMGEELRQGDILLVYFKCFLCGLGRVGCVVGRLVIRIFQVQVFGFSFFGFLRFLFIVEGQWCIVMFGGLQGGVVMGDFLFVFMVCVFICFILLWDFGFCFSCLFGEGEFFYLFILGCLFRFGFLVRGVFMFLW